jgi:heme oxygenase
MISRTLKPGDAAVQAETCLADRLKRETRDAHDAIEAVVEALRPFDDRARYARFLSRSLGFYRPVERELAAAGILDPARAKCGWIERDLEALGAAIDVPEASFRPPLDRAARFGSAYVLEGATLGGRILVARVRERLGLSTESGARFLAGYGDRTGAMWTTFRETLLREIPASEGDALVDGARVTFREYGLWLGRPDLARGPSGAR